MSTGDREGLNLVNKLKMHIEKNVCQIQFARQVLLTEYFKYTNVRHSYFYVFFEII